MGAASSRDDELRVIHCPGCRRLVDLTSHTLTASWQVVHACRTCSIEAAEVPGKTASWAWRPMGVCAETPTPEEVEARRAASARQVLRFDSIVCAWCRENVSLAVPARKPAIADGWVVVHVCRDGYIEAQADKPTGRYWEIRTHRGGTAP